jgi:hypothetical protein
VAAVVFRGPCTHWVWLVVRVCVPARACVRVCVCVPAGVRACVRA